MNRNEADPRVYAGLRDLNLLKHRIRGLSFSPKQPVHSLLSGRHASRVRGRGLNFEEIRVYQPGDDVRTIDWKVTARMRSAHTRVFTEQRDRPVLLLVDQRMSMFFGSQLYMKSVTAAHAAALAVWQVLEQGDRIGGIVFSDQEQVYLPCLRSQKSANRILATISRMNQQLSAVASVIENGGMLAAVLEKALRVCPKDHLIIVVSDFIGFDSTARSILKRLRRRNDVIGMLVHDPLACDIPPADRFVLSNGELQVEISGTRNRKRLVEATSGRIRKILQLQQEIDVPVLPLSTGSEVLPQLLRLLGRG